MVTSNLTKAESRTYKAASKLKVLISQYNFPTNLAV
jgi:hypothetical protein